MFCEKSFLDELNFSNGLELFSDCKKDELQIDNSFFRVIKEEKLKDELIKNQFQIKNYHFGKFKGGFDYEALKGYPASDKVKINPFGVVSLEFEVLEKGEYGYVYTLGLTNFYGFRVNIDLMSEKGKDGIIFFNDNGVLGFASGNDKDGYYVYSVDSVENVKYQYEDIYSNDNGFLIDNIDEVKDVDELEYLEFNMQYTTSTSFMGFWIRNNNSDFDMKGCFLVEKKVASYNQPFFTARVEIKSYKNDKINSQFEIKSHQNFLKDFKYSILNYHNKKYFCYERIGRAKPKPKRIILKDFDDD